MRTPCSVSAWRHCRSVRKHYGGRHSAWLRQRRIDGGTDSVPPPRCGRPESAADASACRFCSRCAEPRELMPYAFSSCSTSCAVADLTGGCMSNYVTLGVQKWITVVLSPRPEYQRPAPRLAPHFGVVKGWTMDKFGRTTWDRLRPNPDHIPPAGSELPGTRDSWAAREPVQVLTRVCGSMMRVQNSQHRALMRCSCQAQKPTSEEDASEPEEATTRARLAEAEHGVREARALAARRVAGREQRHPPWLADRLRSLLAACHRAATHRGTGSQSQT